MAFATRDLVSPEGKERGASSTDSVAELEPSLGSAAARVLDLTQRVAIDRIELLQVESYNRLVATARNASLLVIGMMCLMVAWLVLLAALVVALKGRWPLEVRLTFVAGIQAVFGFALLGWARRRRVRD